MKKGILIMLLVYSCGQPGDQLNGTWELRDTSCGYGWSERLIFKYGDSVDAVITSNHCTINQVGSWYTISADKITISPGQLSCDPGVCVQTLAINVNGEYKKISLKCPSDLPPAPSSAIYDFKINGDILSLEGTSCNSFYKKVR